MLQPILPKNDKKAKWVITLFSIMIFVIVSILGRYNLAGKVNFPFNVHFFAMASAIINFTVALLLIAGIISIQQKKYLLHKKIMLTAIFLSVLFLLCYVCHHLLAGETKFGDTNHDGILSETEKINVGSLRIIYYFVLATHIPLAAIILPFILFVAYRALIGEYTQHKKLARLTWPVWFYVAVTGVIVYLMISPYYK